MCGRHVVVVSKEISRQIAKTSSLHLKKFNIEVSGDLDCGWVGGCSGTLLFKIFKHYFDLISTRMLGM